MQPGKLNNYKALCVLLGISIVTYAAYSYNVGEIYLMGGKHSAGKTITGERVPWIAASYGFWGLAAMMIALPSSPTMTFEEVRNFNGDLGKELQRRLYRSPKFIAPMLAVTIGGVLLLAS